MSEFKTISAEEFAGLELSGYTVIDLREPSDLLLGRVKGAINIPASQLTARLDSIPKDKPVVLFCRVGIFSEQAAAALTSLGYDAAHVKGGFNTFRDLIPLLYDDDEEDDEDEGDDGQTAASEPVLLDLKGLKCPGPIVKVADFLRDKPIGTRVRVEATEDAFYSDIRVWCERTDNRLDALSAEGGIIRAEITRATAKKQAAPQETQNGKTFVVFSGDLDKTIAAFIIANGAAAMGRRVTMFFTFWGLNILRRPEKVKTAKGFVEKMFAFMMPRGTKKLGLSRMNMGGAGAKMIRAVMKAKGISSLEELIDNAKTHGVRIVACQMSMDIMGISKEELIDGVELGGVSTFLGSCEESDTSLFI